jgi:hypothetical protein
MHPARPDPLATRDYYRARLINPDRRFITGIVGLSHRFPNANGSPHIRSRVRSRPMEFYKRTIQTIE